MSLLEIRDLKITFGGLDALSGLNFHIDEGEIVEIGPPDEVFANPAQERTRAFFDKILY